ncbi:MAG: twin-arginine translocase TatA/TatE family subunit [bacterium]|nr:twin-arginine translocase TatA/TatE family subunit [bacterium]
MFDSFSGAEILTIAVIALVVFGPGRLPEIARTIGGYLRELKAAVTDLRRGIEDEIGPLREPIKEIREDIRKPVSDVRRTLAETADTAKSVEREIRQSAKAPPTPSPGQARPASPSPGGATTPEGSQAEQSPAAEPSGGTTPPETAQARWIAPDPPTGVSPSKVWEGMGDPMPGTVHPPPDEGAAADGQDTEDTTDNEMDDAAPEDEVPEQGAA